MQSLTSLIFYINWMSKNQQPTQNLTKTAKNCQKTALERRRVKQIHRKYRQKTLYQFRLSLLHYRFKKNWKIFFSKNLIGFFKKINFYRSQYQNDSWYRRCHFKMSEFYYFWKRNGKKVAAYAFEWPKVEKIRKMRFFAAGLRKIIGPKNKKTLKSDCFLFHIYVIVKKSTAYAKFWKNLKNLPKFF